jgi:hypothetical protein
LLSSPLLRRRNHGALMSINVEILGESLLVQHFIEEIGQPDRLRLRPFVNLFQRRITDRRRLCSRGVPNVTPQGERNFRPQMGES